MVKRELKIEDRNIPVRTRSVELEVYSKDNKRLGIKFGDTIRIPIYDTKYPKKWRGEKGIVVERYRSVNRKPNGMVYYNPGVEVLFMSDDPSKHGKVRRYCNKMSSTCKIPAQY